jgi:hypothetical protein
MNLKYHTTILKYSYMPTYTVHAIASEEHFLLQCPLYNTERVKLLTKIIVNEKDIIVEGSTLETFVNLMSSKNCETIFSLCKFIQKGFKLRSISSTL